MNNEPYEPISDALNTSFNEKTDKIESTELVSTEINNEVVQNKKEIQDLTKEDIEKDYDSVRKNLYSLLGTGKEAIDGILKVAHEGDSPRAYEVVSQLLKSVSDINKDLMDLHRQVKEIHKDETTYNQNTTNAIYVGSTSDLQDLINPERSRNKEIIDVETVKKKNND